jgi:selenium-binding protein 1
MPGWSAGSPKELAYVVLATHGENGMRDAIGVVDIAKGSETAGQLIGRVDFAEGGDEVRRLGSCLARHPRHGAMITSVLGTPDMIEGGVRSDLLLEGKYGRTLDVWNIATREHVQSIDLGAEQQMVLGLCPANNPTRAYGFAGVGLSLEDLSASVFLWYLCRGADGSRGAWQARRVISIPARPASPAGLPPLLRDRGVVPPLVSDINLSVDDRWLYVSCWGTGELRRYDVADPFNPVLTGLVRLGGIVRRAAHPGTPGVPRSGGPQMTAVTRDGRSVYATNSLYASWDEQFYPDGLRGWMAKADTHANGGLSIDPGFFVEFEDGLRPHRVLLSSLETMSALPPDLRSSPDSG